MKPLQMVRFRSIRRNRTVTDENGEEQTEELNFDPFYAAAPLPDLTNDLETGGLSVTNAIAVNPYSVNRDAAAAIARYLTVKKGLASLRDDQQDSGMSVSGRSPYSGMGCSM